MNKSGQTTQHDTTFKTLNNKNAFSTKQKYLNNTMDGIEITK